MTGFLVPAALALLLLACGFALNHYDVRTAAEAIGLAYAPGILALAMAAAACLLVWRMLRKGAPYRWVAAILALLLLPAALLVGAISAANLRSTASGAARVPASVSLDAASGVLRIEGTLFPATTREVIGHLRDHRVARVDIDSPGGDGSAADRLATALATASVPVRVLHRCASACVHVWAASPHREARRNALIGLHRSHLGDGKEVGGVAGWLQRANDRRRYQRLALAGIPRTHLDAGLATPGNAMLWIPVAQLQREGMAITLVDVAATAPLHVPGKPLAFPVDAASVLEALGRQLLANCESAEPAMRKACLDRLGARAVGCFAGPDVFDDLEQYKAAAKRYTRCVMPRPLCRGIEVTDLRRERCGR